MSNDRILKNTKGVGVYIIHNPNTGQVYAGSGDLAVRKQKHFRDLANGKEGRVNSNGFPMKHPNRKLQAAYNADPNFVFLGVPIHEREAAFDCEQAIIDKFNGNPKFLNMSRDARAGVYEITDDTRRKHREREITSEHREKLRQAGLGRVPTPETIEKLRAANTGRIVSDETKNKLKEARTRQVITPEHRAAMSAAAVGKTKTEEHRRNIGIKTQQQWDNPEYRDKMRTVNSVQISVKGTTYSSIKDAAKTLGMSVGGLQYKLSNPKETDFVRL